MNSIKVVTICGSMKFQKEMVQIAEKLELEKIMLFYNVFLVIIVNTILKKNYKN